jgi:hypothetical protein
VHVDAGVDIAPFAAAATGCSHVEFLADRVDVRWAGFSMVDAMVRLVERGVDGSSPDDHVVVLSGVDAVVRPIEDFVAFLRSSPRRQHLRYVMVDGVDDPSILARVRRRHRRDLQVVPAKRRSGPGHLVNGVARRLVESLDRLRPPGPCPGGLSIALGSQWFALTAACASDLLHRRTSEVDRWFRTTFAPDETYFATLLAAGPFAGDNAAGGPEPFVARGMFRLANHHLICEDLRHVYTIDDLDEIVDSGRFFVRKVRLPESAALLDAIERTRDQDPRT